MYIRYLSLSLENIVFSAYTYKFKKNINQKMLTQKMFATTGLNKSLHWRGKVSVATAALGNKLTMGAAKGSRENNITCAPFLFPRATLFGSRFSQRGWGKVGATSSTKKDTIFRNFIISNGRDKIFFGIITFALKKRSSETFDTKLSESKKKKKNTIPLRCAPLPLSQKHFPNNYRGKINTVSIAFVSIQIQNKWTLKA